MKYAFIKILVVMVCFYYPSKATNLTVISDTLHPAKKQPAGISCKSLDTKDSTESLLQQVRHQASPYNNVKDVLEKMPNEFFDTIDADELVDWIENGFKANPPVPGINSQTRAFIHSNGCSCDRW